MQLIVIYIQSNILVDIVKCPVSPDLKMWGHHDLSTSLVLIVQIDVLLYNKNIY